MFLVFYKKKMLKTTLNYDIFSNVINMEFNFGIFTVFLCTKIINILKKPSFSENFSLKIIFFYNFNFFTFSPCNYKILNKFYYERFSSQRRFDHKILGILYKRYLHDTKFGLFFELFKNSLCD